MMNKPKFKSNGQNFPNQKWRTEDGKFIIYNPKRGHYIIRRIREDGELELGLRTNLPDAKDLVIEQYKSGKVDMEELDIEIEEPREMAEIKLVEGFEVGKKYLVENWEQIGQTKQIEIEIMDKIQLDDGTTQNIFYKVKYNTEAFVNIESWKNANELGLDLIINTFIDKDDEKKEVGQCSLCNTIVPIESNFCLQCGGRFTKNAGYRIPETRGASVFFNDGGKTQ